VGKRHSKFIPLPFSEQYGTRLPETFVVGSAEHAARRERLGDSAVITSPARLAQGDIKLLPTYRPEPANLSERRRVMKVHFS
jgi:hypothetical protein